MKFLDAGKSIVPNTSKAIAPNKNKYNFISIQLKILYPSCRRVTGEVSELKIKTNTPPV